MSPTPRLPTDLALWVILGLGLTGSIAGGIKVNRTVAGMEARIQALEQANADLSGLMLEMAGREDGQ